MTDEIQTEQSKTDAMLETLLNIKTYVNDDKSASPFAKTWDAIVNDENYEELAELEELSSIAAEALALLRLNSKEPDVPLGYLGGFYVDELEKYLRNVKKYQGEAQKNQLCVDKFNYCLNGIRINKAQAQNAQTLADMKGTIEEYNKIAGTLKAKKVELDGIIQSARELSKTAKDADELAMEYCAKIEDRHKTVCGVVKDGETIKHGLAEEIESKWESFKEFYDTWIKRGDEIKPKCDEIDTLFNNIQSKNENMVSSCDEMNEKVKTAEEELAAVKLAQDNNQEFMRLEKEAIEKLHEEIKGALGESIEVKMVQTFQDEYKEQNETVSKTGRWILVIFAGMVAIGIALFVPYIFGDKEVSWVAALMKVTILAPFAWAAFFMQHKNNVATILSAEYRYKQSIVEAMIGYRARYEANLDKFSDGFKNEYTKFFDKTFEEINKNPADKINKMVTKRDKDNSKLQNQIGDRLTGEASPIKNS